MGWLDENFSAVGNLLQENAPIVGAAIGAASGYGLAGAGLGLMGGSMFQQRRDQQKANEQNVQMNAEQMAFQERMSSTAHQREVEDLRKAGLNPMLSYNSSASSPSGSQAQVKSASEASGASAMQMAQQIIGLEKLNTDTDAVKASTESTRAGVDLTKAQTAKTLLETDVAKRNLPEAEIKEGIWRGLKNLWQKQHKYQPKEWERRFDIKKWQQQKLENQRR